MLQSESGAPGTTRPTGRGERVEAHAVELGLEYASELLRRRG